MILADIVFVEASAGYFHVKQGKLHLQNTKDVLNFVLDYTVTEVPQTLTHLEGSFK